MRFLVALILALLATNVAHAGVVVWMGESVPDGKVRSKADAKTGGTKHAAGRELLFQPAPAGPTDDERYETLRQVVADGKKRWNEFDVEYDIAKELEAAITAIDVIRTNRDRDELVAALLFQGAAVAMAFGESELIEGDRAKPFRYIRTGGAGIRPWSDAYALMPDRAPLASDVADGSRFPQLQQEFSAVTGRAPGTLTLIPRQEGETLVLDGKKVDAGTNSVILPPGRHWLHIERKEGIAGRQVVIVEEGRETAQVPPVPDEDLQAARARVLAETTAGIPESVKAGLDVLAQSYGGAVFVGVEDGGRMVVLPYAHGAELLKQRKVTFLTVGEVGGGALTSTVFDSDAGQNVVAPAAVGSLGAEIGIYNGVILLGTDLAITPGNTITHANKDLTANVDTSVFFQPYGGVGFYLLRPTGRAPTALVGATYSWLHPSHHAVGGRVSLGVPFQAEGGTWVRMTLGGAGFPTSMWDEGGSQSSMVFLYARAGLATRF